MKKEIETNRLVKRTTTKELKDFKEILKKEGYSGKFLEN